MFGRSDYATLAIALFACSAFGAHDQIYWTNSADAAEGYGGVYRAGVEGGLVVSGQDMPWGVAVDSAAGKVYWSETGANVIKRANLDGSNTEVFHETGMVGSLVMDAANGWLYFLRGTEINRIPLIGGRVETVVPGGFPSVLGELTTFALDPGGDMLYWPDGASIKRTDSEGVRTLIEGQEGLLGVAVAGAKAYWCNGTTNEICRSNLDGSAFEPIVTGENSPSLVSVDSTNGKVYWTTANAIRRANLNGTGVETVLGGINPFGLALDVGANRMYWTDPGAGTVNRATLGGTGVQILAAGRAEPAGIAVDASGGKMYWAEMAAGIIYRSDLDGANVEMLIPLYGSMPVSIAVDGAAGKLYWSDVYGTIWRSNLNGSSATYIYGNVAMFAGLALDATGENLYWTDMTLGRAYRARAAGYETLYTGTHDITGVTFDEVQDKVWWWEFETGDVKRSNPDGSGVETVMSAYWAVSMAVDGAAGKVYWSSLADEVIYEAAFDGTGQREVCYTRDFGGLALSGDKGTVFWCGYNRGEVLSLPLSATIPLVGEQDLAADIELDQNAGKIYWSEFNTGKVHRSNLDGSAAEDLLTGLSYPAGLALDLTSGKIYWSENAWPGNAWLHRASLDGTGAETVAAVFGLVIDVELDLLRSRIYWTDIAAESIYSCDLSGGDVQQILTSQVDSPGLALDVVAGKIYFGYMDEIYRCDMDGQNKELVVSNWGPSGITLDVSAGKVYWTESRGVLRADMADGSNVEHLYFGLPSLFGIALDVPVRPVVYPISNASVFNNDAYSVTPSLIEGTMPVTWSLALPLALPTDMAVDTATGRVTWTAAPQFSPLDITLSACNAAGCGVEDWTVTVVQGNTIACSHAASHIFEGIRLELIAPEGSNYQWKKNGVPLENGERISGVTSRVLVLDPLELGDAGTYTCQYENGETKTVVETEPFELVVQETPQVPATGVAGLLAAVLALAIASALALRRQPREEK